MRKIYILNLLTPIRGNGISYDNNRELVIRSNYDRRVSNIGVSWFVYDEMLIELKVKE